MSGLKIDPEATYFIDTNIWLYAFIQGQDADKKSPKTAQFKPYKRGYDASISTIK